MVKATPVLELPTMFAIALILSTLGPLAVSAEPNQPDAKIELQVAKDASITYRDEMVTLADLAQKLKDIANKAGTTVILNCHPDTRTGDVQEIIRRLQEVGFEKFTLRARK